MGACVRILWHSNAPWASTGYGVQTQLFAPRLRDLGHEVAISAFYGLEGGSIEWAGMPVYPKCFHPYGLDVIANHADDHKADIVITLVDAWVLDDQAITKSGAKWVPWFPVDHDPIPDPVIAKVRKAWQPLTYSKHAQKLAEDAGLGAMYVPHGVDTTTYAPRDKGKAKQAFGIDPDTFVVGIVAANKGTPSRKALPTQFEAFARFHEKHPNSVLYLHSHTGPQMEGLDLVSVLHKVGVPESAVKVCNEYMNLMGYDPMLMAALYNAMDVLCSATMGEGFGVPIIEAQACGTPVIVTGATAMPELVGGGWVVDDFERVFTPMNAYQYMPSVAGVTDALEKAYQARGDKNIALACRAMAEPYDADTVTAKYWKPALEAMHARLFADKTDDAPAVEVIAA
jgi:glycosyltransferase involved in cell wall biosynthesis